MATVVKSVSVSPWALAPVAESDPRFLPCSSIKARYPGVEGNALQDKVFADYLLCKDGDVRLPFFSASGRPCFVLNNRNLGGWRAFLVRVVEQKGLHEGVRGQAWAVPGDELDTWLLISHATLAEAI